MSQQNSKDVEDSKPAENLPAQGQVPQRISKAKLIRLAFGIAMGLVSAELFLAIADIPPTYKPRTNPPQFFFPNVAPEDGVPLYMNLHSAEIVFEYADNPRGYFGSNNEVVHRTNSLGFRGNEFALRMTANGIETHKPKGTFRIAFLGDSFTFGEGVKDEDVYPELAINLLNKSNQFTEIAIFEAYNFGVGGYNTTQSLKALEGIAIGCEPDLVVLGFVLNDAEPAIFRIDDRGNRIRIRRSIEEVVSDEKSSGSWSRIIRLANRGATARRAERRTIEYYRALYQPNSKGWVDSSTALDRLVTLCDEQDIPCVVLLFPLLINVEDYQLKQVHREIRDTFLEIASQRKLQHRLVDLLPSIQQIKVATSDLWVHPTDHHPNEIVHRVAAEILADVVRTTIQQSHQ